MKVVLSIVLCSLAINYASAVPLNDESPSKDIEPGFADNGSEKSGKRDARQVAVNVGPVGVGVGPFGGVGVRVGPWFNLGVARSNRN